MFVGYSNLKYIDRCDLYLKTKNEFPISSYSDDCHSFQSDMCLLINQLELLLNILLVRF